MSDERMQSLLELWFEDTDPTPPDTRQTAVQVMAQVLQTPQRGRWLPVPVFYQRTKTPISTDQATGLQPSPILPTNGHTPTVTGRTQSMFSPVKAIAAGALVFALGGALLIAQPFDQQGIAPGAVNGELVAPVAFTSTYAYAVQPAGGARETIAEGVRLVTGMAWQFRNVESTDPRFEGTLTLTASTISYPEVDISTGADRIENDGGAWQEVPNSQFEWTDRPTPSAAQEPGDTYQTVYIGEDGYDGLTAVVVSTYQPDGAAGGVDIRLEGFVLEGGPPEAPEPWFAE